MAGAATRALDPDVKSGSEVVLETTNAPRSPERPELLRRPVVYPASLRCAAPIEKTLKLQS